MAFRRTTIIIATLSSAVSLAGCGHPEGSSSAPAPASTTAPAAVPAGASVAWAQQVCVTSTGLRESVQQLSAAVPTDPSSSSTTAEQIRAQVGVRVGAVQESAASVQTALTSLPAGADPDLVAKQQQLQTASQRAREAVDQLGVAAGKVTAATTATQTTTALLSLTATLSATGADVGAYLNAVRSSVDSRTQVVRSAFGAAPACADLGPSAPASS
ncbi:hypothetical protein ACQP2Y_13030 [Actinoplanes sp. CA-051413]|uniref:hypothetical protein n=1 Tax=Actinoplanes sp. CA-051413 TaxID=3239899 RepID=UPI003D99C6FD